MQNDLKQLLEFGPFQVDPEQRLLLRDQQPVALSPKAFDLLVILLERSGQIVHKDELMKMLWPDTFVEESNLGQHIFLIRKALGERAQGSSYIVTVPGRGYRFAQKVRILPREVEDESSHPLNGAERSPTNGNGNSVPPIGSMDNYLLLDKTTSTKSNWRVVGVLTVLAVALAALVGWNWFRPLPVPKLARVVHITNFGRVEPFSQALGDGSKVFFAERTGGTRSLATVPQQGGNPTLVWTSVENLMIHDVDRQRSRLLVTSGNSESGSPLWIVPSAGGSAQRIGEIIANSAVWSADHQQIAYSIDTDLFIAHADGSTPHKIFSAPGVVEYLRWSPDSKRISLTVRDLATSVLSLWQIEADGRKAHQLSFDWPVPIGRWGEGECCGDWSPDGRFFIFRSRRDRVSAIWIMPASSNFLKKQSAPTQLYSSSDRLNQPRFSADGRHIYLIHYHERRELSRYDKTKSTFTPYLDGGAERLLSFSRDGKWVAYRNESDGSLWRSRTDGSQALQLTSAPMDSYHPAWSPDGKQIAFDNGMRLYIVSVDGGVPRPLLPNDGDGIQPSWSPDGAFLIFTSWPPWRHPNIYKLDLRTGETSQLPGALGLENAEWSPDGKHIAASNASTQKIMLFNFASQSWSDLAQGSPDSWGIRWSKDSRLLYFQSAYNAEEQPIFRIHISDRSIEQITSSRQLQSADVLTYLMTGLTPENDPVVSLVYRNSDIDALELNLP